MRYSSLSSQIKKEYELLSKVFIIVLAFLMITMVFGYYWLLIKNYDTASNELLLKTLGRYLDDTPSSDGLNGEDKLKIITETIIGSGRAFMITRYSDGKEIPVFWNRLPENSDPSKTLLLFQKTETSVLKINSKFGEKRLYFPKNELIRLLRFYPFFLAGSIVMTIFITGYLYFFMRRNEKQSIWIAVSKETAHQLGTPLSSLSGWADYLADIAKDNSEIVPVAEGIREDVGKITLVTERFSKISSEKDFGMCDISAIIERSANYILRRVTADPERMSIKTEARKGINVYVNQVLIEWTVENLLKNSVESIPEAKKGEITVRLFEEKNKAVIEVEDNGSGIQAQLRKKIFETGFTTKKRGWGLGLSLSKKIIEQYHNGKLFLKKTGHDGTVFRIELNKLV
jgi:two-component system, sporulation sensor kinase D